MAEHQRIRHAHNFKDMTGMRFGMLTVIRFVDRIDHDTKWECRCDCGTDSIKRGLSLRRGGTKSCGCNQGRPGRRTPVPPGKYCWQSMKQRCYYANDPYYYLYGGRGISVCEEWRTSFEAFMRDMGPRPSKQHTVERLDGEGNYEPGNCCWATAKEQGSNRRNNCRITYGGITRTLVQWSEELGIKSRCLAYRLKHWDLEKAMTTPVDKVKSKSSRRRTQSIH